MKKIFIVANWKTYPLKLSPKEWISEALAKKETIKKSEKEKDRETVIVVCPPYSVLSEMRREIDAHEGAKNFIHLGTQDISHFPPGAHTGDEAVENLKNAFGITYAIIG